MIIFAFERIPLTNSDGNGWNYAQRYQLPVIHLIDKNLANTSDFIPEIDSKRVKVPQVARIVHSPEWNDIP